MYAAIRRYNVIPGSVDTIIGRVNSGFLPLISQMPGFQAYYVVNPGDGTFLSVSVFEDRAGAEESTKKATEWVKQNIAHLIKSAPVIMSGDVVISSAPAAVR